LKTRNEGQKMLKRWILLLLTLGVLTGCGGRVVVFGHTMGEEGAHTQAKVVSNPGAEATSNATAEASSNPAAEATSNATAQPTSTPGVQKVSAVTLALTSQAEAKVANDPRFKVDELLNAVEGELKSRDMFDGQDPHASGTAEILIDDFATRSTSNAVVFGYNFAAGTLTGDVRLRDAQGHELQHFKIAAEARLTIAANGEDSKPLAGLYRRFATLAADRVAGVP
jgi:hypothetical protein